MKKLLYLLCILFIFSIIASLTNPPKVKELRTKDYQLQVKPFEFINNKQKVYSQKKKLLYLSKQTKTLDFLTNNTGMGGDFKHLRVYPNNYMSEAVCFITPEMQQILSNNNKTQKEYQDWGRKNNLSTYKLYPGQSIKIYGREFSMQNYIMNWGNIEKDIIKEGNLVKERVNILLEKLIEFSMQKNLEEEEEIEILEDIKERSGYNTYLEFFETFRLKKFHTFAASLNYRFIDAFIASYKNTILGWTGNSKDLSATYSFAFRDKLNIRTDGLNTINLFSYYFIKIGSMLPYLFLILTIYSIWTISRMMTNQYTIGGNKNMWGIPLKDKEEKKKD